MESSTASEASEASKTLPSASDLYLVKTHMVTGVCDQLKSAHDASSDKDAFWADAFDRSMKAADEAISAFECAKNRVETFFLLDGMNRHFALLSGVVLFLDVAHQYHSETNSEGAHDALIIRTKVYSAFITKKMQDILDLMHAHFHANFIALYWNRVQGFHSTTTTPVFVDMFNLLPYEINPFD